MAAVIDNKNLPKERMQRITMLIITRSSLKRCEYKVTELGILLPWCKQ